MLDGLQAKATIKIGLDRTTSSPKSRGFIVTNIYCDKEGAIARLWSEFQDTGINGELSPADNYVGDIEMQVKIVKKKHQIIE